MSNLPREGSRVCLARLQNDDLNGKCGTVKGYVDSNGGQRVMVSLDSGPVVKVKPHNLDLIHGDQLGNNGFNGGKAALDIPEGSLVSLVKIRDPELNGARGIVAGYANHGERVIVTLESGPVKVKPINLQLIDDGPPPEGARVCLVRVQNPDLNGQLGVVTSYANEGKRVVVTLDSGSLVKVKPNNLDPSDEEVPLRIKQQPLGTRVVPASNRLGNGGNNDQDRGRSQWRQNPQSSQHSQSRRDPSNGSQMSSRSRGQSVAQSGIDSAIGEDVIMLALEEADRMFDMANTSGDEEITKQEFELYMKRHTNHNQITINEIFAMMDANNSGTITRDEVHQVYIRSKKMQRVNIRKANTRRRDEKQDLRSSFNAGDGDHDDIFRCLYDADRLFLIADKNMDGHITEDEFASYMKNHTKHAPDVIATMYRMIDADNDGKITIEEIREAHIRYGEEGGHDALGMENNLGELLGLKQDDLHLLADDVYNMFFLSDIGGGAFFYCWIIFAVKMGLFLLLAFEMMRIGRFPLPGELPANLLFAQFLLLPVAVAIEEELITTFFIYGNLEWSPGILTLNPGAKQWKYHVANLLRFLDGVLFLTCNMILLLQSDELLDMMLNFTALEFVSTIDNLALELARDGYLNDGLQLVARNVTMMKLPRNQNKTLHKMDSVMMVVFFVLCLTSWILLQFVLPRTGQMEAEMAESMLDDDAVPVDNQTMSS